VGAVVVRGRRLVGQGYHRRAGTSHAEVIALKEAGSKAAGATLYVSLEPCSTWGRTAPCTDLIIDAGVRRVVIAVRDPGPRHRGRGVRRLRAAGIETIEGVGREEGERLIVPFTKWVTAGTPFLTLKLGVTLDGRIADGRGRSRWITGRESRQRVREMRHRVDGIVVGRRTACADDPSLLHGRSDARRLFRVIVDSTGRLPVGARVLTDEGAARTIVATTSRCPLRRRERYRQRGATLWVLPSKDCGVSLRCLMRRLGELGLLHVLCEGGGELARGLIDAHLVDEYLFFVAPRLLGAGGSVPCVGGGGWRLDAGPRLDFVGCERLGKDFLLRAVAE